MDNDKRRNPRFLTTSGTPASIQAEGKVMDGTILNFSSTGFAIIANEAIDSAATIEVTFKSTFPPAEIRLTASIINKKGQDDGKVRLGCHITDMNDKSKEYFSFLTGLLGKQGFIRSMATKPVKVRQASGES